jgi:hypothetical protein
VSGRKLSLDDIADARAYEREREGYRARVIELKRIRRVAVGPVVSVVFENRDTIRFQVQEMARAERIMSDAGIEAELDVYNPLIPEPGELSATLYIELTSRAEMEEWLPKLVGVERAVQLEIGDPGTGRPATVVRSAVDPAHEASLTREEITASVHYVRFSLTDAQIERFREETVALAVDHPSYRERTALSAETKSSLLDDLLG